MGMYVTLAALDASSCARVEAEADALARAAVSALKSGTDAGVADFGKVDDRWVNALEALTDAATADAFFGDRAGQAVGTEDPEIGAQPRYFTPRQVASIAGALTELIDAGSLPRPDEDGYSGDPRVSSDPRVAQAVSALENAGFDPYRVDDMDEVRDTFERLAKHYARAAARGEGMLIFIR